MLGLCCQYLEAKIKKNGTTEYINTVEESGLQYNQFLKGKYSNLKIQETWVANAKGLLNILKKVNSEGIKVFRVSSNLFPLYDSVSQDLRTCQEVKSILRQAGDFVLRNNMRVTSHPDQFVVLSSNKNDVISKSVTLLDYHAWIFDQMNLPMTPYYAINIHGGTRGNSSVLVNSIKNLPESTRKRLTLENDELSYNVKDLYSVFESTGTPIVFDTHHHSFNDASLSMDEGLKLAMSTWGDVKPVTHLSNTEPNLVNGSFTERRKHSDYVHYIPDCQKIANNEDKIDIELEFKMKNLALNKAVQDFNLKLN